MNDTQFRIKPENTRLRIGECMSKLDGTMSDKTHELRVYASVHHERARFGDLLLHLWFRSEHAMKMDLDIALNRSDVAYVDLIDCQKYTTERHYNAG